MNALKPVCIGDFFDDEGCTWEVVRQLPPRSPASPRIYECAVVKGELPGGSHFAYSEAEIARARGAVAASVDDGGPAFPALDSTPTSALHLRYAGLSLRDYFAAKAMQSIYARMSGTGFQYNDQDGAMFRMAEAAYNMADAMLRARAKGGAA